MAKFGDASTQSAIGSGGTTLILTGSGPPVEATGATGNMYLDTTGHVLYGPKTASAAPVSGYTQPTTGFWSAAGGTGGGFQAGNEYHIVNALRVVSLRYNTPPDLLSTRTMGIWRIPTNELLSPIVSTGTEVGGGWKEVPLTPPVDLLAGDNVRIAATCSGSIYYSTPPPPMQVSDVTITTGLGQNNGSGTVAFPSSAWGYYFPMDMKIEGGGVTWATKIKSA